MKSPLAVGIPLFGVAVIAGAVALRNNHGEPAVRPGKNALARQTAAPAPICPEKFNALQKEVEALREETRTRGGAAGTPSAALSVSNLLREIDALKKEVEAFRSARPPEPATSTPQELPEASKPVDWDGLFQNPSFGNHDRVLQQRGDPRVDLFFQLLLDKAETTQEFSSFDGYIVQEFTQGRFPDAVKDQYVHHIRLNLSRVADRSDLYQWLFDFAGSLPSPYKEVCRQGFPEPVVPLEHLEHDDR